MPDVLYKNIRGKKENNGWDYPIDKKPVVTMQETVGYYARNHRLLCKKPMVSYIVTIGYMMKNQYQTPNSISLKTHDDYGDAS